MNDQPKRKPLRAFCVGHGKTLGDVAAHLGLSRDAVKKWEVKGDRKIPAHHVPALVEFSGGALTPHDLRPDLYPREAA